MPIRMVAASATRTAGATCRGSRGSRLLMRHDPVSDTADGLDPHPGARQLGAQPGEMDVDGVRAQGIRLVVPDLQCDRPARHHRGGASHQHLQDAVLGSGQRGRPDRKSTRLNSSHVRISYAVFCLKKKKKTVLPPYFKKKKKKNIK